MKLYETQTASCLKSTPLRLQTNRSHWLVPLLLFFTSTCCYPFLLTSTLLLPLVLLWVSSTVHVIVVWLLLRSTSLSLVSEPFCLLKANVSIIGVFHRIREEGQRGQSLQLAAQRCPGFTRVVKLVYLKSCKQAICWI